jgi:periplasmic protein CpxP/Spy
MKKITVGILAVSILTIGLVGLVFAQKHGGGFGEKHGGFGGRGFLFGKIAEELGLSEEQKTQVKAIMEASKAKVQPIAEALKEGHQTAKTLGTDGVFDEAKVTQLANNQAELTKQLIIEKEKTKAALFAILTSEQRTKAATIHENFEKEMKGKRGRFGGFGGREGRGSKGEAKPNEE